MTAAPEPRRPLSRERILEAALALADAEGIAAVSMRKLGQALGFEAMSLYNHVAGKKDVVDGILDLVLAETEPPPPGGEWTVAVKRSAMSIQEALRRHTWAATLLMSAEHVRPERLRYMDALLGRLRAAGFSPDATYHAYHVLDAYIFGYAVWHTSHSYSDEDVERIVAAVGDTITSDTLPHLHEHAQQHMSEGAHQEVSAFEYGLDVLLDGLDRIRRAQ